MRRIDNQLHKKLIEISIKNRVIWNPDRRASNTYEPNRNHYTLIQEVNHGGYNGISHRVVPCSGHGHLFGKITKCKMSLPIILKGFNYE